MRSNGHGPPRRAREHAPSEGGVGRGTITSPRCPGSTAQHREPPLRGAAGGGRAVRGRLLSARRRGGLQVAGGACSRHDRLHEVRCAVDGGRVRLPEGRPTNRRSGPVTTARAGRTSEKAFTRSSAASCSESATPEPTNSSRLRTLSRRWSTSDLPACCTADSTPPPSRSKSPDCSRGRWCLPSAWWCLRNRRTPFGFWDGSRLRASTEPVAIGSQRSRVKPPTKTHVHSAHNAPPSR